MSGNKRDIMIDTTLPTIISCKTVSLIFLKEWMEWGRVDSFNASVGSTERNPHSVGSRYAPSILEGDAANSSDVGGNALMCASAMGGSIGGCTRLLGANIHRCDLHWLLTRRVLLSTLAAIPSQHPTPQTTPLLAHLLVATMSTMSTTHLIIMIETQLHPKLCPEIQKIWVPT